MLFEATRPPWLYKRCELEAFVEKHNPTLSILQLRCDRNRCQLVSDLLHRIVSTENPKPSKFEMNLAKIHLAVDLQNLFQKWCGIGLKKTVEGSALWSLSGCQGEVAVEHINTVPKTEAASSPTAMFPPAANWAPLNNSHLRSLDIAPSTSQATSAPHNRPAKRSLDVDPYEDVTKIARVDKTPFVCPYYARDPNSSEHAGCADKTFPNPRKLKEHVWRWLKPFKCSNCGEGFGREKTRAIHFEQRKTKCKKTESRYEESLEYRRDIQIESAKSTQEMIDIFEKYEKERAKDSSQGQDPEPTTGSQRYPAESERSSSPDSQSGSLNSSLGSGSDGEVDSGEEKYTGLERRPSIQPYQNSDGAYTQYSQQNTALREETRSTAEGLSPHTPEERSTMHGRLSPMSWQQDLEEAERIPFNVRNRGKSAPSYYSPMSTSDFHQPPVINVPEIRVTPASGPEPLIMDMNHASNQHVFQSQSFQYSNTTNDTGSSYYADRMEEPELTGTDFTDDTGVGSSLLDNETLSHNPQISTTAFVSQGYRSWEPFVVRVKCK